MLRWFAKFRSGDFGLADEEGGRKPSIENDQLGILVKSNPQTTIESLVKKSMYPSLDNFYPFKGYRKGEKLNKLVLHLLNEKQKEKRYEICSMHFDRNESNPFLSRIITCGKKWISNDNCKKPGEWIDQGSSPRYFPKPSLHPKKVMITVWWSQAGLIPMNSYHLVKQ